uniref:Putative secreted protein n=1 Tax=Anopheles darlingi TaxID=43151 RepID=A0A2M4DGJ0_ANODA
MCFVVVVVAVAVMVPFFCRFIQTASHSSGLGTGEELRRPHTCFWALERGANAEIANVGVFWGGGEGSACERL